MIFLHLLRCQIIDSPKCSYSYLNINPSTLGRSLRIYHKPLEKIRLQFPQESSRHPSYLLLGSPPSKSEKLFSFIISFYKFNNRFVKHPEGVLCIALLMLHVLRTEEDRVSVLGKHVPTNDESF